MFCDAVGRDGGGEPVGILSLLAIALVVESRALAGEGHFAKASPAIRVAGIAALLILVSARMWG